jgi:predicted Zn-dependent protease
MIFAVAGVVFGFVLGYMVANASGGGTTRVAAVPATSSASSSAPASAASSAAAAPARDAQLDPAEVRTLTSLAEREKQNVNVRVELGQLFLEHEQPADAVRWFREALAVEPGQNDVRADLGAALIRTGQIPEALTELETVLKKDPAHKSALFNKGFALMQSGQTKLAVSVWEDLLKRYPNDPQLKGLREQMQRARQGAGPT